MTFEGVRLLVMSAMMFIGRTERVPQNTTLADAISAAVMEDPEQPITGTKDGDAALLTTWSWAESRWRECDVGDKGKSRGPFQLQGYPIAVACAAADAARIWLHLAHLSVTACKALEPDARLAQLASGTCGRGRVLSRSRMRAARAALAKMEATNE
jgi:hypothetical protein